MKRFPFQQGPISFLGTPLHHDRPVAFLGLPYDAPTTYRSGARMGPQAIRTASLMLTDGEHPIFHGDPALVLSDWGDAAIPFVSQKDALGCIEHEVSTLLRRGMHPVLAGGDHSVTLGVLRALRSHYGETLACVHFDAHCDTWPDHFGDPTGHGTWTRNAIEEGLIDPTATTQIGIRSPVDAETAKWLPERGGTVLSASEAMDKGAVMLRQGIEARLGKTPTQRWNRPVYVSFDIDALDPAHAPGTGTPEIGGLTSMWALQALQSLHGLTLVGMDVVEVAPSYDRSDITALAAATLLWTYVAMHPTCAGHGHTPIP